MNSSQAENSLIEIRSADFMPPFVSTLTPFDSNRPLCAAATYFLYRMAREAFVARHKISFLFGAASVPGWVPGDTETERAEHCWTICSALNMSGVFSGKN